MTQQTIEINILNMIERRTRLVEELMDNKPNIIIIPRKNTYS
jgi:hypothetical protein